MSNTNANGRVVAPAVLQAQLSTDVVGFNLENNQANALSKQYITFQETFLPGEVTTGAHLVAIVNGQKIPVQMDVKTFNADGSVNPNRNLPKNAGFGVANGYQTPRSMQLQLRFSF